MAAWADLCYGAGGVDSVYTAVEAPYNLALVFWCCGVIEDDDSVCVDEWPVRA